MSDLIIVRDTVQPENMTIDDTYQAVLAYRDGLYRWPPAQVQRFLEAGKLVYPITVLGAPHLAQIADCERGDIDEAEAANFAEDRNALHHDATIYVDLLNVPGLLGVLLGDPCWLWVADWTGEPHTPALTLPANVKVAAVQYASNALYDTSEILSADWPASPWKGTDW
jgi:hypothetical protein